MRLRRSARTILTTVFVLVTFTLLTIWHNKPSGSETELELLMPELAQNNSEIVAFLNDLDSEGKHPGFYVISDADQTSWPVCPSRASYSDPLARFFQNPKPKTLIRYRSPSDLVLTLDEAEEKSPGTLAALNIGSVKVLPEPPFALSLRFIVSIFFGMSGVWLVKWVNQKTKNSGKRSPT